MKSALIVLSAAILTFAGGCSSGMKTSEKNDFSTEGFIADSCYQVIVRVHPDASAQGLVAQRDSAYIQAKKVLRDRAESSLLEYCVNIKLPQNNASSVETGNKDSIRTFYSTEIIRYRDKGSIAAEYYLEDNSVVIVYRIMEPGMKNRLEALYINPEKK